MCVGLSIILIIFAVILHELGHAFEMKKKGIGIQEIGLGFGFGLPPLLAFKLKRIFPGTKLSFNLVPIGAFVRPTEEGSEKFKNLGFTDAADICAAGAMANILFGLALAVIYCAFCKLNLTWCLISVALIAVLCCCKKFFYRYAFLPLGLLTLLVVIYSIAKIPLQAVAGPVGLTQMTVAYSTSVYNAICFSMLISFSVALTQLLPFYPLDGGLICMSFFKRFGESTVYAFRVVTLTLFLILIIFTLFTDILRLLT